MFSYTTRIKRANKKLNSLLEAAEVARDNMENLRIEINDRLAALKIELEETNRVRRFAESLLGLAE